MDLAMKIKLCCAYAKISEAELSRRLGTTPQGFNRRLKTGKFTLEELQQIAKALGGDLRFEIVMDENTAF